MSRGGGPPQGSGERNGGEQKSSGDIGVKAAWRGVGLTQAAKKRKVVGMILGFLACMAPRRVAGTFAVGEKAPCGVECGMTDAVEEAVRQVTGTWVWRVEGEAEDMFGNQGPTDSAGSCRCQGSNSGKLEREEKPAPERPRGSPMLAARPEGRVCKGD